jgi:hypothetical protein
MMRMRRIERVQAGGVVGERYRPSVLVSCIREIYVQCSIDLCKTEITMLKKTCTPKCPSNDVNSETHQHCQP